MPDSDPNYEPILDSFSTCYPVSGDAVLDKPYCVEYRWDKRGYSDLLMLAHPLHVKLLSNDNGDNAVVLDDFKYKSIDGELVGVVGDSWSLRIEPFSINWHSIRGVEEKAYDEIISALIKDVEGLVANPISTTSSYHYGKLITRAARLVLIAEEVYYTDVIPTIAKFLREAITPWLDGTLNGNGFLYDKKWGGMVTKQGATTRGLISGLEFLMIIIIIWGTSYMQLSFWLLRKWGTRLHLHSLLLCQKMGKLTKCKQPNKYDK